jgi:hypothetical protein
MRLKRKNLRGTSKLISSKRILVSAAIARKAPMAEVLRKSNNIPGTISINPANKGYAFEDDIKNQSALCGSISVRLPR